MASACFGGLCISMSRADYAWRAWIRQLLNLVGLGASAPFHCRVRLGLNRPLRVQGRSKAGAIGLTHSYAALLAKEGITANAIAPALIETEMVTANPKARPELIPVGRFGTVEEVAEVVVMLANNGYITDEIVRALRTGTWNSNKTAVAISVARPKGSLTDSSGNPIRSPASR